MPTTRHSLALVFVLSALAACSPRGFTGDTVEIVDAPDRLQPTAVAIVAITADGRVAKSPVHAVVHDPVTLHAVLRGREDGKDVAVTDAAVIASGATPWPSVPVRAWSRPEETRLTWLKVEPKGREYWNTEPPTMKFSFKKVPYAETVSAKGVTWITADARPTTYEGNREGHGTMRFQLTYTRDGARVATPGASAMNPTRPDSVFRVAYSGATKFPMINHALELCNVPYIFGSESPTHKDADHQSEFSYGVDCADLVSYASRHSGLPVPYGFTGSFDPDQGRTSLVKRPARNADGIYVDGAGKPIRWGAGGVQTQDLVLFDGKQRHIGILYRDEAPLGVLDANDVIVHTLCEAPSFVKVSEAYGPTFQIVRLKRSATPLAAAPEPVKRAILASEPLPAPAGTPAGATAAAPAGRRAGT